MPVTFHLTSPADRAACNDSESATVKMTNLDQSDAEQISLVRDSLVYAFEDIWNVVKVTCMADHEIFPNDDQS